MTCKLCNGDTVYHKLFGRGTVINLAKQGYYNVLFDNLSTFRTIRWDCLKLIPN